MLRIGITGGIGSGKSTVARVFEALGIPVYYADNEAKRIMQEDEKLKALLIHHFGEAIYKKGVLDKVHLSSLVFNNKEKLDLLNSIVHPATIHAASMWMKEQTGAYVVKEAALIFESGAQEHLDFIIGVSAPVSLRINRVVTRDKVTIEQVQQRMKNQIPDAVKMRLCDAVVTNDEKEPLLPQVLALHELFLQKSSGAGN
ncbi:MAG: dephospho-CoA kinase [Chitinophagaceae bacterium]|nr:dephospho-CoA kinase [Chitinophagaceae bacterium]